MEREKYKNSLANPSLLNMERIHEFSLASIGELMVEVFIKPRDPIGVGCLDQCS